MYIVGELRRIYTLIAAHLAKLGCIAPNVCYTRDGDHAVLCHLAEDGQLDVNKLRGVLPRPGVYVRKYREDKLLLVLIPLELVQNLHK